MIGGNMSGGLKVIPETVEDFGISLVQVREQSFSKLPVMAQKWFYTFARILRRENGIISFKIANYRLDEFMKKLQEEEGEFS
jgi:hypothetical protein